MEWVCPLHIGTDTYYTHNVTQPLTPVYWNVVVAVVVAAAGAATFSHIIQRIKR